MATQAKESVGQVNKKSNSETSSASRRPGTAPPGRSSTRPPPDHREIEKPIPNYLKPTISSCLNHGLEVSAPATATVAVRKSVFAKKPLDYVKKRSSSVIPKVSSAPKMTSKPDKAAKPLKINASSFSKRRGKQQELMKSTTQAGVNISSPPKKSEDIHDINIEEEKELTPSATKTASSSSGDEDFQERELAGDRTDDEEREEEESNVLDKGNKFETAIIESESRSSSPQKSETDSLSSPQKGEKEAKDGGSPVSQQLRPEAVDQPGQHKEEEEEEGVREETDEVGQHEELEDGLDQEARQVEESEGDEEEEKNNIAVPDDEQSQQEERKEEKNNIAVPDDEQSQQEERKEENNTAIPDDEQSQQEESKEEKNNVVVPDSHREEIKEEENKVVAPEDEKSQPEESVEKDNVVLDGQLEESVEKGNVVLDGQEEERKAEDQSTKSKEVESEAVVLTEKNEEDENNADRQVNGVNRVEAPGSA